MVGIRKPEEEQKVKISVSLSPEVIKWLDEGVASKDFGSRSHGIEKVVAEYRKSKGQ